MGTKILVIDGDSLIALLTAYSDGRIPLDTQMLGLAQHPALERLIGIWASSAQWEESEKIPGTDGYVPLHIRYEARKLLKWAEKSPSGPQWDDEGVGFEVPR